MWTEYLILCPSLYERDFDPEVIVLLFTLGSWNVCLHSIYKTSFYAGGKTVSLLQRLAYNIVELVYSLTLFCEEQAAAARKCIQ
jgi:hypothetical protein